MELCRLEGVIGASDLVRARWTRKFVLAEVRVPGSGLSGLVFLVATLRDKNPDCGYCGRRPRAQKVLSS